MLVKKREMSNSANCFAGLFLQEQSSTSVEDVFLYSGVQKSSATLHFAQKVWVQPFIETRADIYEKTVG